jgi:enoyl-CoA hydratase/carnithine racemase
VVCLATSYFFILYFFYYRDFMKAIITFPKPLIAVVTGSAIGLGMTMLPLCDIVYASDKALFYLPYSQLAQTPEGCASFMLPNTVGMAMESV